MTSFQDFPPGNWNSIANCVPFPLALSHFPFLLSNHFEFPDNFRFLFVRKESQSFHSMKTNKACKSSTCSEAEILHFYCFYYVTSCSVCSMCARESVEHYVNPPTEVVNGSSSLSLAFETRIYILTELHINKIKFQEKGFILERALERYSSLRYIKKLGIRGESFAFP